MSVAFRRDCDEEHLEPKFEIPIPPGPNFVTAGGLVQIQNKVIGLETALPGLIDEAEIAAAKRQLRYWRTRQATAQTVEEADGKRVSFGTIVSFTINGHHRRISIVGDDEAEPAAGLLSFSAPLCKAMIDAEVEDLIDFGNKADAIEILAIEPCPRCAQ